MKIIGINSKELINVNQWEISSELGIIASPIGNTLILQPRLSRLIFLLFENANAIVSRDYLTKEMWPDTFVNEESLTRAIADLRKILSANFGSIVGINTIRKRGYQLSLTKAPKKFTLKLRLKNPLLITWN